MKHWCSATSIASSLQWRLESAGVTQLPWDEFESDDNDDLLLIYNPPDQILEQWRIEWGTAPSIQQLKAALSVSASRSKDASCCISGWRLAHLDSTSIIRLCRNELPILDQSIAFPEVKALSGLITINLLNECPDIHEHYLDLELRSCLLDLEADSNYLERLKGNTVTDLVLMNWWEVNAERESSREESMGNLTRLHQIQADFDKLVEEQEQLRRLINQQNILSRRALTKLARLKNDAS
tara:strand:+ start:236 stop:952 length:717 start_codon:yes stop_codon:yes gene_type:complete